MKKQSFANKTIQQFQIVYIPDDLSYQLSIMLAKDKRHLIQASIINYLCRDVGLYCPWSNRLIQSKIDPFLEQYYSELGKPISSRGDSKIYLTRLKQKMKQMGIVIQSAERVDKNKQIDLVDIQIYTPLGRNRYYISDEQWYSMVYTRREGGMKEIKISNLLSTRRKVKEIINNIDHSKFKYTFKQGVVVNGIDSCNSRFGIVKETSLTNISGSSLLDLVNTELSVVRHSSSTSWSYLRNG